MSAGLCTFHRVLYLGWCCPACVAQNRLAEVVANLCELEDQRDALRAVAKEHGVVLEIEDDVEL